MRLERERGNVDLAIPYLSSPGVISNDPDTNVYGVRGAAFTEKTRGASLREVVSMEGWCQQMGEWVRVEVDVYI